MDFQNVANVRFTGYVGDEAVFKVDRETLCSLDESEMKLQYMENGSFPSPYERVVGVVEFVGSAKRYVERFTVPFKVIVVIPPDTLISTINFDHESASTDFENKKVYFGREQDNDSDLLISENMAVLDLSTGDVRELPIKGIYVKVIGNYLFYADYPNPEQFDLVYDIYRVKIGDWSNPEMIFKANYMNGWKVSADGRYLLVETIETGSSPQAIIYSIDEKTYSPIDDEDIPQAVFYSRKKKAFCFYDIGLYSEGRRDFVCFPIPEEFPYQPFWALDFGDSFITHYLLDEAKEEELRRFDSSQLRLMRNAIFARKGWRFQSADLQQFFGQFPWYQDQMNRYSGNSEIKLTNSDRYRAQLIQGLEKGR